MESSITEFSTIGNSDYGFKSIHKNQHAKFIMDAHDFMHQQETDTHNVKRQK